MSVRHLRVSAFALAALTACGASQAISPEARQSAAHRALVQIQAEPKMAFATAGETFTPRSVVLDADGSEHVHFDRTHRGLRVIGGDFIAHVDGQGKLHDVTQTLTAPITTATVSAVAPGSAQKRAANRFKGKADSSQAELVIFARDRAPVLAYDVRVAGIDEQGHRTREHVLLDAHDLTVLDGWSEFQSADTFGWGVSHYEGSVAIHTDYDDNDGTFSLVDATRGGHAVYDLENQDGFDSSSTGTLMTDVDNQWGDGVQSKTSQSDGVDAMYGQNMTWDFYVKTFNRFGIADDGRGATSRVHAMSTDYLYNAWWDDSCFCMTYTSEVDAARPDLVSLDVVGHEMTHGVTSNTAGLYYSGESGGLNEGTSDIMGTMVEFFANNAMDPPDYTMGENFGTPFRYMYQPSLDGRSSDCWYPAVGNLDVHFSSGVANHVFYLMAQGTNPSGFQASPTCRKGDTRNATGNAYLAGIGNIAAQAIWYRALTTYFTSTTDYASARCGTLRAAADLYGAGSPIYNAVAAAWNAVLVG